MSISFNDLKRKMADGSVKELQKAIHELKPDADPKAEIKKASEQAKQDIKSQSNLDRTSAFCKQRRTCKELQMKSGKSSFWECFYNPLQSS